MMSNEDELPLLTLKSIHIEEFIDDMSRQILDEIWQNKYILEKQLDILIEIRVDKFCFIRCLHNCDQPIFKKKYIKYFNYCMNNGDNILYNSLCNGGIRVIDWNYLMEKCSDAFYKQYFVYRQSYYGEHSGIVKINLHKANFWSKIKIFGNSDRKPINLLVNCSRIDVSNVVRESSFVNANLVYWNNDEVISDFNHI